MVKSTTELPKFLNEVHPLPSLYIKGNLFYITLVLNMNFVNNIISKTLNHSLIGHTGIFNDSQNLL